jgi:hypothetical protein
MDFKPFYDRVQTAQANKQRILNAMNAALQSSDPAEQASALGMEAELDAAITEEGNATNLYTKVVNASKTPNIAENFVPVSDQSAEPDGENQPKDVMKLTEFHNLTPRERLAFAKAGGKLED